MSEDAESGFFTELAEYVERIDNLPFQHALAAIEATRHQGADGKYYVRWKRNDGRPSAQSEDA